MVFENLSYKKKLAFARFSFEVAAADEEITDDEIEIIATVGWQMMNLNVADEFDTITDFNYGPVLSTLTEEEAIALGAFLGTVAEADGIVEFSELSHIESLLKETGLNPLIIQTVLKEIQK